jgi:hypothetical protein
MKLCPTNSASLFHAQCWFFSFPFTVVLRSCHRAVRGKVSQRCPRGVIMFGFGAERERAILVINFWAAHRPVSFFPAVFFPLPSYFATVSPLLRFQWHVLSLLTCVSPTCVTSRWTDWANFAVVATALTCTFLICWTLHVEETNIRKCGALLKMLKTSKKGLRIHDL